MNKHDQAGILNSLAAAVEYGKTADVIALLEKGMAGGMAGYDLLHGGLIKGMTSLGVKFKNHLVFIPDVLVAARALKKGSDILRPVLIDEGVKPVGKALVATVAGDLHDIGKNLVCMMLEGAGLKVVDLGVDVSAETIIEEIKKQEPDILALSALLNTTLNQLANVIAEVDKAGLRGCVRIMVGGAPVDKAFAQKIGADAYAGNAVCAAETAKKLLDGPCGFIAMEE
ncbi:MAG: cobalamin-dependent protein [Clostridiales bacterium]|nr:cobalamin-dependent protein [Clostridiales bacterium]